MSKRTTAYKTDSSNGAPHEKVHCTLSDNSPLADRIRAPDSVGARRSPCPDIAAGVSAAPWRARPRAWLTYPSRSPAPGHRRPRSQTVFGPRLGRHIIGGALDVAPVADPAAV